MAYLGLARKWRPQTFDDLIGQGNIARTILNAIKTGRIGQGYLFTGTRGIGKTSAARIFAKALRCQNTKEPGVPCQKCNDCLEISEGRAVDVLEIDGASNNGVDAVREIRENAKYLPNNGAYKIYIIDEVHMLTTAAFNALLKTLEEPPAHVVFIFATTDPQKIPATILSRTQRFDFKRVAQKELQERLSFISNAEKTPIAPEALAILAREAEGSMRDAVSLLDQVLASDESPITAQSIARSLGLVDKQTILDCVTGILKREPLKALEAVGKVYDHGFDLRQFGREILRYLRQLMVARLLEQNKQSDLSSFIDVSDVDLSDLRQLIHARALEDLDMLFRLLNHGLEDVARSTIPKMVMDVLIIKMSSIEDLVSLSDFAPPEEAPAEKKTLETGTPLRTAAPSPQAAPKNHAAPPSMKVEAMNAQDGSWWFKAIEFIKAQKPLAGSVLEHMGFHSISLTEDLISITLGYTKDSSFYKEQLQSRAYNEIVTQLLKNYLGSAVRLEYKEVLSSKSIQEVAEVEKEKNLEKQRRTILESEAMKATQQLLGAKLERLDIRGDALNNDSAR